MKRTALKRSGSPRRKARVSMAKRLASEPSDEVRAEVAGRSGGVCEVCRQARATVMHHRLPRSAGGPHTAENLLHLCAFDGISEGCHEHIHAHPEEAYRRGWLIRRGT